MYDGVEAGAISARFHETVVALVAVRCEGIRESSGVKVVALSGGVWQNRRLLRSCIAALERSGFEVLTHRRVPANDGGISLGQAAVAAARDADVAATGD